ncbi:MAG: protoheme IX farnesyltransferase [Chloroflexi bacterium]|nr:protoheme IX farnesyltransferase [Chloroflexota bacterium]
MNALAYGRANLAARSGSAVGALSPGAYLSLAKPRVVSLVLFTAVVTTFAAARGVPPWTTVLALVISGGLVAGGAAALNHYFDRDIDVRMARTSHRPLVSGRIQRPALVALGGTAAVVVGLAVAVLTNEALAWAESAGAFSYVAVYTLWLKRRSVLGVVIGGATGSAAVLGGWAAVDPALGLAPWLLAALVFLWTPPHFWSLGIARLSEYRRAGVPTLPVVAGPRCAARWSAVHILGTVAASLWLGAAAQLGAVYFSVALLAGLIFLLSGAELLVRPVPRVAWRTFKLSGAYLGFVFLGLLVDVLAAAH